jgi:Flp pilus assembly protein protease CpaA
MVLAITMNIVLAAIVFTGVILLIMRAIRSSDASAPAAARRPVQTARARRRAGAPVPARPWA